MPRARTLKRLEKRLVLRRAELLRSLRDELADLGGTGDAVQADPSDAAVDSYAEEVCSHLAEFESVELTQIEDALERIREKRYGRCEVCGGRIPEPRLNALPFTSTCIRCQRDQEISPARWPHEAQTGWNKVYESEVGNSDREPDVSALESGLGLDISMYR